MTLITNLASLVFWHSDKPLYQRDSAEIACHLFTDLGKIGKEMQKQWFEAFIYIFNKHWDSVDNFRIDKYLMFLRLQFSEVLQFLKENNYNQEVSRLLQGLALT